MGHDDEPGAIVYVTKSGRIKEYFTHFAKVGGVNNQSHKRCQALQQV